VIGGRAAPAAAAEPGKKQVATKATTEQQE
jgi:hypothetical protein